MALRFNENRFRQLQSSQTDTLGIFLRKKGYKIEQAAKLLATDEGLVRTGRYRDSIAWKFINMAGVLVLRVGSAVPHARLIERGTPPHRILPRHPKDALWWTHGAERGWVVPDHPLNSVQHPGTRPYRILQRATRSVLRNGGT